MNTVLEMDAPKVAGRVLRYLTFGDPTFTRWAEESMVWLPEKGMGFLPAEPIKYDDDYWEKYEEYAQTALGRRLTVSRIELIERHIAVPEVFDIIDIGIGCGDFIERARESWHGQGKLWGYDVSRRACEWLTDRAFYRDPYSAPFHAATMWDSLEHVFDPRPLLENVEAWLFCSLPIVPGDGPPPRGWKHIRPGEHLWYWTRDGFIRWMAEQGFLCVEHGTQESLVGREDIHSFAFRRVE